MVQARKTAEVASRRDRYRVALVGAHECGKSLLMRRLTGYAALSQDRLFSTLDTRTRRAKVPGEILLSDTVGFIRKLPHRLVASFRATLEEVREADLLLHVVDASAADSGAQVQAVEAVLQEIGVTSAPAWKVWNKLDRMGGMDRALLPAGGGREFRISALSGEGVGELLAALGEQASLSRRSLLVSCSAGTGGAGPGGGVRPVLSAPMGTGRSS